MRRDQYSPVLGAAGSCYSNRLTTAMAELISYMGGTSGKMDFKERAKTPYKQKSEEKKVRDRPVSTRVREQEGEAGVSGTRAVPAACGDTMVEHVGIS